MILTVFSDFLKDVYCFTLSDSISGRKFQREPFAGSVFLGGESSNGNLGQN